MRVYRRCNGATTLGFMILIVTAEDSRVFASTSLSQNGARTLSCPEISLDSGDACPEDSVMYSVGNVCSYWWCCPGEGGNCFHKYERRCSCDYNDCNPYGDSCYDGLIVDCYDDTSNCPSVCPEMPANTNDVCYIGAPQYSCTYTYPLIKDEPGYSNQTKECLCNFGKFVCSCSGNECPTQCPQSPLVHGDECSVFYGGYCNYTQPCCIQGVGEGICIANSTCFCDESKGLANCTTLPVQFCTRSGSDSTIGTNSTSGGCHALNGGTRTAVLSYPLVAALVLLLGTGAGHTAKSRAHR